MAASNSMTKPIGPRTDLGANSTRKIETPSDSGTAMSNARVAESSVPTISGQAPNSSLTGSQMSEVRKPKPNLSIAGAEPR